jgi:hypothetical protein
MHRSFFRTPAIVIPHAFFLQRVDDHFHIGHGGGEQRRHAENVRLVLVDRREIFLDRVVDADIDDLEARTFHHHGDEVFADVVNVALDRADHHLAEAGRASLGQQRTQDRHAGLHRVGGKQHFRNEQDAVAEIYADDAHALDQGLGQGLIGRPTARQQDMHGLLDLFLEAIIEVVMNLLGQLLVIQGVEVKFAFIAHSSSPGIKPLF